jgi:hypothetical protein
MIKKAVISWVFFLLLAGASLWYFCFHILPKDLKQYEQDLKTLKTRYQEQKHQEPAFEQLRTNVHKNMWIFRQERIEHHHILASSCHLKVKKASNRWEIEELLHQVTCSLDDGKNPVKVLQAAEGLYNYKTKAFTSAKVKLWFLDQPVNMRSLEKASWSGFANDVFFSLQSPEPTLTAKYFFATSPLHTP